MKKSQPLLSLLILIALTLSACGGGITTINATESDQSLTPTHKSTSANSIEIDLADLRGLQIQLWHALIGPDADLLETQIGRFNLVNEWGINVSSASQGGYTNLFEKINTGMESGTNPDIVVALPEQALTWDESGWVVDLNPFIKNAQWGLTSSEISDFPSVFWSQDDIDGRRLGVPAERSARFLISNITWARELGFNHTPTTAEEFRQQACAANASFLADENEQNDGYGGWVVDSNWLTVYSWLLAFGGGVVDAGEYHFKTKANQAALVFIKGLFDDHCAWLSTAPNPYEVFAQRSSLFMSVDLAELPLVAQTITNLGSTDEWMVLPFPGSERNALVTYGPSYSIIAATQKKQLAAWLFIRWLLSSENQAEWTEAANLFPLRTSTLELLANYSNIHPQWEAAVDYLSQAENTPQLTSWRTVRYVLEDGTFSIFRMNLSLEQIPSILQEMDSTADEIIE